MIQNDCTYYRFWPVESWGIENTGTPEHSTYAILDPLAPVLHTVDLASAMTAKTGGTTGEWERARPVRRHPHRGFSEG